MAQKRKPAPRKGRCKQVIDYDPLAWLEGEGEQPAEAAGSESAPADSAAAATPDASDGAFGFFDDAPAATGKDKTDETGPESVTQAETVDESAFGFFDEEPEEPPSVEDDGYGFFDDASPQKADTGENALGDAADGSYGFFDDAVESAAGGIEPWADDEGVIHLGAELGIRTVQQAHGLILERMAQGQAVRIEAGALQKIDSAGLQMIYSLRMTLEKTAQSIAWQSPSPLIDQRARELGMPELVGDHSAEGSDDGYGFF